MQKYPLTLPCLLSGDLPENWGEPPQLQATDEPWEGAPVEPKQPLTLYSPGKTPRALDGDRVTKLQCVYDQQRRMVLWCVTVGDCELRRHPLLWDDVCRTLREAAPGLQTGEAAKL